MAVSALVMRMSSRGSETFKKDFLEEIEDHDIPMLSRKGDTNLQGLIDELGYDYFHKGIYTKINNDKTIDLYIKWDPVNLDEGYSFLKLNDLGELKDFQHYYDKRSYQRTSVVRSTTNGLLFGFAAGFVLDAAGMLSEAVYGFYYDNMIKNHE